MSLLVLRPTVALRSNDVPLERLACLTGVMQANGIVEPLPRLGATGQQLGAMPRPDGASGISYQQMEITYSNFEKTLRFPAPLEGATIEHLFENGLLIITLTKAS